MDENTNQTIPTPNVNGSRRIGKFRASYLLTVESFELLRSMEKDLDIEFQKLKVDGGMVSNNLLMQFQSDILNKTIISQEINEITALGAGVASFIFAENLQIENVGDFISTSETWNPNMSNESRENLLTSWFKAIEKSKHWL